MSAIAFPHCYVAILLYGGYLVDKCCEMCALLFQDKGVIGNKKSTRDASDGSKDFSLLVYNSLLKNEILGTGIEDFKEAAAQSNTQSGGGGGGMGVEMGAVALTGGYYTCRRQEDRLSQSSWRHTSHS